MAHHHGTPGRSLVQSVGGLVLAPVAMGFGVYLAFLVLGAMNPFFRVAAPLGGLVAAVAVLRSRSFERELIAKGRGALGENLVGRVLRQLPTGWRVFHDVQLDGENVDHVVVSNRGVFSIEVKNYSGTIKVGPSGVFAHGQRNDRIVQQSWRQAHRLKVLLKVDVQPLLVFARRDVGVTRVGQLQVLDDLTLVPWLLRQTERALDLESGRRVFTVLESLVAGSAPRGATVARLRERSTQPMQVRTSASHPLQVFWVPGLATPGSFGLTFAPGKRGSSTFGYRWARDLGTDLARLRTVHRADVLISLLEHHEYDLLEIPELLERAEAIGLNVHHFPIPDVSVPPPETAAAFGALVAGIRSELDAGKRVVVHCRDGIGRSGLLAAAVATTNGDSGEAALARVRTVQPNAVETPEQEAYVAAFVARDKGRRP